MSSGRSTSLDNLITLDNLYVCHASMYARQMFKQRTHVCKQADVWMHVCLPGNLSYQRVLHYKAMETTMLNRKNSIIITIIIIEDDDNVALRSGTG